MRGCMAVLTRLADLSGQGRQIIAATHSPILLALPGATIYRLAETGETEAGGLRPGACGPAPPRVPGRPGQARALPAQRRAVSASITWSPRVGVPGCPLDEPVAGKSGETPTALDGLAEENEGAFHLSRITDHSTNDFRYLPN